MEYRIIANNDELYHHGVKGMRWGHRKQPERTGTSRPRKKMSTAKKVAIGVGIAAGIAGVAYISSKGIKSHKATTLGVSKLKQMGIATFEAKTINSTSRNSRYARKLTGHSQRLTRYGAARNRATFYQRKMETMGPNWMRYEDARRTASEDMARIVTKNGGKVPKIRPTGQMRKLSRSTVKASTITKTQTTKVNAGKKAVKKYTARNRGKLTGHSTRNTKLGAAKYRQNFYKTRLNNSDPMDIGNVSRYMLKSNSATIDVNRQIMSGRTRTSATSAVRRLKR